MKIEIKSDLHREFMPLGNGFAGQFDMSEKLDTVLVLAGDIDKQFSEIKRLVLALLPIRKAIIMVAGNHEFYGNEMASMNEQLKELSVRTKRFHYLYNDTVTIDNVKFIGTPMFTNMKDDVEVISAVQSAMNDFRVISINSPIGQIPKSLGGNFENEGYNETRRLRARDYVALSAISQDFLEEEITKPWRGKKVVITHWSPSLQFTLPMFKTSFINSGWYRKQELLFPAVDLWAFGHLHNSTDEVIDGARCVCNPFGYENYASNPDFEINKVVDL